jgi:hypothetical protein
MDNFNLSDVISEEYRKKLEWATKEMPWGGAVIGSHPRILKWAKEYECKSILDYGSGKSDFLNIINVEFPDHGFQINQYEPGRPEFAMDPPVSDMSICVDVLEHIEPEKLDNVLDHIYAKTNKIFYFKVCLVASHSTFPDGQNLHLIIEDKDFWIDKLSKYYTLEDIVFTSGHVWGLAIKNN